MRLVSAILLAVVLARAAGTPKADLTLKDVKGQKVHLRDLRGKPVVLNFWATWCAPCNAEMPILVELEKQYAARGVVFVAASLDDAKTSGQIPEFLTRYHVGFSIWYGATADDMGDLKMGNAVPATAILDPEGHIVARILGQARPGEVNERLEWLLGDRNGPAPEPLLKHLEK
jgi:thiol-disulfide isomerase/thioredoxin